MNAYVRATRIDGSWALWLGVLLMPMGCSPAEVDPVQLASGGAGGAGASCGDGTCAGEETAQSCPADCASTGGSGGAGAGGVGGAGGGALGGGGAVPDQTPMGMTFGNIFESSRRWANFDSTLHADPTRRGHVIALDEYCFLIDLRVAGHEDGLPTGPSPGSISVSGGSVSTMTLDPVGDGKDHANASDLWEQGDVITASAPGAELPAFEVELTMPAKLELTSPDLEHTSNGEIHIDRASPYEVTWTPTAHSVQVEMQQRPGSDATDFLGLACRFPGGDGVGTLPVEGLGEFLADASGSAIWTLLAVAHVDREEITLAGRPFWLWAGQWIERSVVVE